MQLPDTTPNNGTRGVLYPILKKPPDYEQTQTVDLPNCFNVTLAKCGDGCHFNVISFEQLNKHSCF